MRVLVTGANGFIGRHLCAGLLERGVRVAAVVRKGSDFDSRKWPSGSLEIIERGDLSVAVDWTPSLREVQAVVHLAGRAHRPIRDSPRAYREFQLINLDATADLAQQCLLAGVERFVYVSSVKAAAERSGERALSEDDRPNPEDAYGKTKLAAEQFLLGLNGLQCIILRPPLVYGPCVRGNFLWLMRAAKAGLPVPLATAANPRSMIYVKNLVDCLIRCTQATRLSGVYYVADAETLSVRETFTRLSKAFGRSPRFIGLSPYLLRSIAALTGRKTALDKLYEPLVVNTSKIHCELGWWPPMTADEGMRRTVDAFLASDKLCS